MAAQPALLTQENVLSLRDPALNGRWFCFVPDSVATNTVSLQTVLVEHTATPFYRNHVKQRPRTGTHDKYPDWAEIENVQMTFYETCDYDVTKWLSAWRKQVYDPDTGYYGLPFGPNGYRRNFQTILMNTRDETAIVSLMYRDCWPVDRAPFELSYAELDGRLTVSATLALNGLTESYGTN